MYTARAHRAGQDEYVRAVTSVYRETRDGWKLVIHQPTPL
jgi:ketosteroid isomerase-like protein